MVQINSPYGGARISRPIDQQTPLMVAGSGYSRRGTYAPRGLGSPAEFFRGAIYENALSSAAGWVIQRATGENPITGRNTEEQAAFERSMAELPADPAYRAVMDPNVTRSPDDIAYYATSRSAEETRARMERVERMRHEIGYYTPAFQIGRVVGGLLDPSLLIGGAMVKTPRTGALVFGGALVAEESVRQATSPEIRHGQDILYVGTIGAGVGGVVGHFNRVARGASLAEQRAVSEAVRRAEDADAGLGAYIDDSVGAARNNAAAGMPGEDFRPAHAFGLERAGILSGAQRLLNATSREAARRAEEFTEIGIFQAKNFEGVGEAAVTRSDNVWVDTREMLHGWQVRWRTAKRDAYRTYAERLGMPTLDQGREGVSVFGNAPFDFVSRQVNTLRGRVPQGEFLTERQFYDRVGEYISRRSSNASIDEARFPPEVQQVASGMYNEIMRDAARIGHEADAFTYHIRLQKTRLEQRIVEARRELLDAQAANNLKEINRLNAHIAGMRQNIVKLDENIAWRSANPPKGDWHMPRVPIADAILGNRKVFEDRLVQFARVWNDEKKLWVAPTRRQAEGYTEELASRTVADRLGSQNGANLQKQLKQRGWQVPLHEFPEFFHMNADDLLEIYVRNVSPDFALMRRYGFIEFEPHAAKINADYDQLVKGAVGRGELWKATKLENERNVMLTELEAIHGMIRGTYGLPANPDAAFSTALRISKNLNAATLLSGLTAQIPDLGNIVLRHGLERSFGVALRAYHRGMFEAFGKMQTDLADISKEALEIILSARAGTISGLSEHVAAATRIERFSQDLADFGFNFALLSNPWNQIAKTYAGMTASSLIGKALRQVLDGTIDKVSKARLRHLGFNTEDRALIEDLVRYLDEYGVRDGHLELPNLSDWGRSLQGQIDELRESARALREVPEEMIADIDQARLLDDMADELETDLTRIMDARQLFGRALGKEIRSAVVTPVPGDAHRYFSTEVGSVILQFKRFASAATQRILISGLQTREAGQLNGVAILVALGFAVNALRDRAFDRPEREFGDALVSAIDRSGVIGIFSDLNNFVETMTSGEIGARAALGVRSRPVSANRKISAALGPTAAQVLRLASIANDLGTNNVDRWTAYNTRRMIPYLNATHFIALGGILGHERNRAEEVRAEVAKRLAERGRMPANEGRLE